MQQFKDSQEMAFRRMVRAVIRRAVLTKSERDVLLVMVNLWFHHKGGPKGYIHPSRESIAKRAGVSVRTVASALSMLRAASIIRPVSGINGGKSFSTRYTVDLMAVLTLCGADWVDQILSARADNCTVSGVRIARYRGAKIAHCLNDVGQGPSQDGETE